MAWIQLIVDTSEEHAEKCSEILMHAGAVAVSFEDAKDTPLFEPPPNTEPLWDNTRVIGLFESNADLLNIKKFLKNELQESEFARLKIESLEDQDWVAATNQAEAICFGNHLWVVPSDKVNAIDPKEICVILDPGLAFGTGSHPTTALCLSWLAEHPPEEKTVLDYGCGSGILGIAALKLKAKAVYAVDHDPQALFSTLRNAQKNGHSEHDLKALLPTEFEAFTEKFVFDPSLKFDLILANILAEPLLELAPRFAEWIKPKGMLILSGILEKQLPLLMERYQDFFTEFETEISNEWVRVQAIRI